MADAVLGFAASVVMDATRRRLAEDLFRELHEMSFDGVGISRETYGPGETAAMRAIEQLAIKYRSGQDGMPPAISSSRCRVASRSDLWWRQGRISTVCRGAGTSTARLVSSPHS